MKEIMGSTKIIPNLPINSTSGNTTTTTIPCLGLGTATPTLEGTRAGKEAILHAIKLGYTHFDTAALYRTEQLLGEAITEALSSGLIKSRNELFITSKLWLCDARRDHVLPALRNSLKNLGLDCLDLYLIHWPIAVKRPGKYEFPVEKEELVAMDFKSVWEAMEECQRLGLTKSIGVSNFSCKKLEDLLAVAQIPPAVNQVEMSPLWQQKKAREFCEKNGILITAYSPLGAKGTAWGTNRVMECEALHEIAASKKKTVAQICLRWVYEQKVSVLVKSHDKNRIKENLDIFDWKLTPEELKKIDEIPQQRAFLGLDFVHEEGPFKSAEELWDGEI